MICCMVDKKNDSFDSVPFGICDEIAQVLAELDISPSAECVPDDVFFWPEKSDKTVYSFCVSERFDETNLSFFRPASFDFWEKFCPFLVSESEENFFLRSAGAIFLYRRISSLFRLFFLIDPGARSFGLFSLISKSRRIRRTVV